jgi:mannosyl-3-phosphoglycerate phosphatase
LSPAGAGLVVVTDLDGTLLDEQTYGWAAAAAALDALRRRGASLVLCSSKTRAEMEVVSRDLGFGSPLVVENGGALVVPSAHLPAPDGAREDGDVWVLPLGRARAELVSALAEIASLTGTRVTGFAELSPTEVARLTGLRPEAAVLALAREYDEPFLLDDPGAAARVEAAARERGLIVTRGGRFFHLMGGTDKGRAVRRLLDLYAARGPAPAARGRGDAANDLPMLLAVDRAIVIPRPRGEGAGLADALPDAELAPAPGPRGWNAAVLAVLNGSRLPPMR